MACWQAWAEYGAYPRAGGWLDQPLSLLATIEAIDLVVSTMRFLGRKEADWTKLTATQRALVSWLETDDGSGRS